MRADPHELVRPPMICSGGDSLSTIWKDDIHRSAARQWAAPISVSDVESLVPSSYRRTTVHPDTALLLDILYVVMPLFFLSLCWSDQKPGNIADCSSPTWLSGIYGATSLFHLVLWRRSENVLFLNTATSGVVVPAKEAAEATLLLLYGAVKLVHAEGFVEVNTGGAERKEARQRNSATHSLSMGECLVPLATCWRTAAVRVNISIYQHG
ncbi:hypothetical protein OPV22_007457 [Ensete ventricosum]|uniref:Uncharacterized protein n=1 Tax=Ensete ventricosum TaxID=4639 RepID=A0AAV8RMZ1_ENSVE|nr:hypothetical protein OPV22_007457 [Ensete ventricosum]